MFKVADKVATFAEAGSTVEASRQGLCQQDFSRIQYKGH